MKLHRVSAGLACALVLLSPSLVLAQECNHDEAKMSCAEGKVWDDKAAACVSINS
ncbi:MAG: hypothetical protein ACRCSU_01985 [Paracoccaceae bacterium]